MTQTIYRFFAEKRPGFDVEAKGLCNTLQGYLSVKGLTGVRIFNRYDVAGIAESDCEAAGNLIVAEPQCDYLYNENMPVIEGPHQLLAVEALPGQYDQRADSAAQCMQIFTKGEKPVVKTAKVYAFLGEIAEADLEKMKAYLINPVENREALLAKPESLDEVSAEPEEVFSLDGFMAADEAKLAEVRQTYGLAMDIGDLRFMQTYFRDEEHREPTITELKMIDTYWSDHCRHTTFMTQITDIDIADVHVKAAYDEYLAAREEVYAERAQTRPVTMMDMGTIAAKVLKKRGVMKNLDESEEINACSVKVDVETDQGTEKWLFMFKNETHNHPTEIEPFGGAATCLGGAIRDPLSGRSYVYQAMRVTGAADPRTPLEETMQGKLPQRQITTTAAQGYASYGNQIGLATGLVDELYHPGYAAKRMEIGAVLGAAPIENVVREVPAPDDVIVLLGGRTGRDGCGGATGSSKSHTEDSLATCGAEVQKGNPVEERKIQRLFRKGEISSLIKRCNDFGAGGVSVAIGELADGLHITLDNVPKKYEGLSSTELAISESQERMAVVLAPENLDKFIAAATAENLEATVVAKVTEEPRLVIEHQGKTIVNLSRKFLDSAGDTKKITVDVAAFAHQEKEMPDEFDLPAAYRQLVGDLNVCSKRGMGERFDGSIGAGSVLMPYGGKTQLTPTQVMAAKIPVLKGESKTASVFSYGFDPEVASDNQYLGAMCAVTESLARITAAGGNPEDCYLTFQEYFPNLKGDPKRWAMPVASLLGAFKAQMAYGVAAIGGKDSMSGSFMDLDVPPTLVSFAAGTMDAAKVLSPEFKEANHKVYLFAAPYDKNGLPKLEAIKDMWKIVHQATEEGKVAAAWALGKGGAAEGLFKMSVGNLIGFQALDSVYYPALFDKNYGGILVEATEEMTGGILIGQTIEEPVLIFGEDKLTIEELRAIWENVLEDIFPTLTADKGTAEAVSYANRPVYKPAVKVAKPKVVIPVFPGTNCEYDTARLVERSGGQAEVVVITNLTSTMLNDSVSRLEKAMSDAQMMIFPGGFSFGDEPEGSGKYIAAFMRNPILAERIDQLLYKNDGLILGICNGFQALIKLGLVPYGKIVTATADCPTLTFNNIGRHQSRYVTTRIASVNSPWLSLAEVGDLHTIPISHGEGRFVCEEKLLAQLIANGQIATQYVDEAGRPSMDIAHNPNGSVMAVEGILSPDGRVFGKMGHSERIGTDIAKNIYGHKDQRIFEAGIRYFG